MSEAAASDRPDPHYPEFLLPETARPAPAVQEVTSLKVACDGDEARGLGHPRVWLAITPEIGFVDCGYCDKRFVLAADTGEAHSAAPGEATGEAH